MRPEAAELRIGLEAGQQIIRYGRDRVVTTQPLVQRLLLLAHRVLLKSYGRVVGRRLRVGMQQANCMATQSGRQATQPSPASETPRGIRE